MTLGGNCLGGTLVKTEFSYGQSLSIFISELWNLFSGSSILNVY